MIFYFASCFFAADEVVGVMVSEPPIIAPIVVDPPAPTLPPPGTQHVDVIIPLTFDNCIKSRLFDLCYMYSDQKFALFLSAHIIRNDSC